MTARAPLRLPRCSARQNGQALVLGLILLFASVLGLYFLFSTGQALVA